MSLEGVLRFGPGARVTSTGMHDPKPGTVVELHFPLDALAVTPVIWDDEKLVVAIYPTSLLVPYLTEDERLAELATSLGFPPRPVQPPPLSDGMAEWRKADREWVESLRKFKQNVRALAAAKNGDAT